MGLKLGFQRRFWVVIKSCVIIGAMLAVADLSPAGAAENDPLDWPHWRGPEQNGISRETGLIDTWDPTAEGTEGNVLWKNAELGGISTPDRDARQALHDRPLRTRHARAKARRSSASTPPPARRSGKTNSTSFSPTCRPSASAGRAASAIRRPAASMRMGVCGLFAVPRRRDRQDDLEAFAERRVRPADHLRRPHQRAGRVRRPGDHQRRDHRLGRHGPAGASLPGLQQERPARRSGSTAPGRCPRTRPTARR